MTYRLVTLERASAAASYRIYTEKLARALESAAPGSARIDALSSAAEARRGGVLRPTLQHFLGRFPDDGDLRHATEPNAALRGVRVVTFHDLYAFLRSGLMFGLFRAVIRSAARRSDRIVTLCGPVRDDVGRWLGAGARERTVVIPPPFPAPPAGRGPETYDLLWVGSVDPRKRPDRFLSGIAALKGPRRRVAFLCHRAPGPETAALEAPFARARARHDIEWIDRNVSEEELDRLYRTSRALVSTSEWEGYHYPVMEAWSRATPVVLPEIPLYRETYGPVAGVHYYDAASGFGPASEQAVADRFAPDPALLGSVSFPSVGRQLIALYEGLPGRR